MQVTLTLEIKLQKHIFSQNLTIFLTANTLFSNPC